MAIKDMLLPEWENEINITRRMLERVPFEKADWKPHEKSFTLGRLATHVAEISGWLTMTLTTSELDFAKGGTPNKPASKEELMQLFETEAAKATAILQEATDENFQSNWTLRNGEAIYFTLPKKVVVRNWVFNHIVHHRAQLSVYLRLLDVPVPGVYGPSADESGG